MRVLKIVLICIAFITMPLSAQMSKNQLQTMYTDYLKTEGYLPSIDSDGDIYFKSEGKTYYIIVYDNDLGFFQLLYPEFWNIESEEERLQVAESASYATRRTKVAKVFMTSNGDTSISAEAFLKNPEDFKNVFPRMLSGIKTARDNFIERMAEFYE
ncbi:MAG: hypothetical protein LBU17_01965 [Treponema sp.]|jgi:hypothetical protein|nr:hypothetical protein [Treponema sp.]